MRALTHRENRIVRLAGVVAALYVVFVGGKFLEARRAEYRKLLNEGQQLKQELGRTRKRAWRSKR